MLQGKKVISRAPLIVDAFVGSGGAIFCTIAIGIGKWVMHGSILLCLDENLSGSPKPYQKDEGSLIHQVYSHVEGLRYPSQSTSWKEHRST